MPQMPIPPSPPKERGEPKSPLGDRCLSPANPKLHLDLPLTRVTFGLSDRRVAVRSLRVVFQLPLATRLNFPP